jgi:protein TonB
VERAEPVYPPGARRQGIQGTVIVQLLVRKDGRVGGYVLVHSVPGLDDAAIEAGLRWRFRPALAKGEPVPVWVAVPMKFTLHP